MKILSLQGSGASAFLRSCITPNDLAITALDWEDFSRRTVGGSWDVGVVEICSDNCVARLIDLARSSTFTALVASMPLNRETIQRVVSLTRQSDVACLPSPFSESPWKFRQSLIERLTSRIGDEFFHSLSVLFVAFPSSLEEAVRQLIAHPERFQSASDLALASNLSRLTCYRYLQRAGLRSPRRLFVAARLLRFYLNVHKQNESVLRAAQSAGYCNPRLLSPHCKAAFGVRPRALKELSSNVVVDRLRDWLLDRGHCLRLSRNKEFSKEVIQNQIFV